MKLNGIVPLYENVFHLIDMSAKSAREHQAGKESQVLSYEDAVKYMALLVGFMLVDRATRDDKEPHLRSYAPIGMLYHTTTEHTKDALDAFWSSLQRVRIDIGTKDVKVIVDKYYRFLEHGGQEQWDSLIGQLRSYFLAREQTVRRPEMAEVE